ncbi:MAG: TonB-dependent receptor [Calditrichaeota bacterium]|nr:MAG: TonB-dependent receptor [Calditrichota bacterium]
MIKAWFVKPVIIISIFGLVAVVWPQSTVKIEGYVFSTTGEPLVGANVVVVGTGFGAATDVRGHYQIENLFAGEYTLQASHIGYKKQIHSGIVVQKDFTVTVIFKLQPEIIKFDEIVIEAPGTQFTSSFQEVLTASQIQKSGARTVGELLINIPGIDIIDEAGGGGRKRISIHGSRSNQVLVLLDGVPLNDPLTGEVDLNQISLAGIEEIRISKGGNSSLHGSGAIGGVVEIFSKKNMDDGFHLDGQFGEFGALGIQPSVAGTFGRVNYFFDYENLSEKGDYPYTYKRADGSTVSEDRLNADFSSNNYFATINFDQPPHSFRIQTHIYHANRGLPGLVFAWTPFAEARTRRHIIIGHYDFHGARWSTQVQFSRYLNESEFKNEPPANAPLRFRTVPPYHTLYRVLSHRGVIESSHALKGKHTIWMQTTLQYDTFRDKDLLQGTAGPIRFSNNLSYSFSLRNEWHLPKPEFLTKIVLSQAIRFDFSSLKNGTITRHEDQWSPNLGLLLSYNKGWLLAFRTNWGRSFRVPTFADLFYQDFRVRGNADLLPEKSWDLNSGVQVGLPWAGWMEFSATYFRHKIENLIVWELGSFATWQPFNTDALLKGWELAATWQLWRDRIKIHLSHEILQALDKSGRHTTNNKHLTYRPEHTTKISLELNLRNLTLNYHRRMIGRRFATPANTVSLPPYSVDDVTVGFKKNVSKIQLHFKWSFYNLFNETYEIVERAPLPGRYWRASIEFGF